MVVTANQLHIRQEPGSRNYPVAASTRIYQGTLAFTVPASGFLDDDVGSGANAFAGVAIKESDNSSGSAGDTNCEVFTTGSFELVGSSFLQADVGAPVYATDNFTITKTRTADSVFIGFIEEFVSATKVFVRLSHQPEPLVAIADPTDGASNIVATSAVIDVLEQRGFIDPS